MPRRLSPSPCRCRRPLWLLLAALALPGPVFALDFGAHAAIEAATWYLDYSADRDLGTPAWISAGAGFRIAPYYEWLLTVGAGSDLRSTLPAYAVDGQRLGDAHSTLDLWSVRFTHRYFPWRRKRPARSFVGVVIEFARGTQELTPPDEASLLERRRSVNYLTLTPTIGCKWQLEPRWAIAGQLGYRLNSTGRYPFRRLGAVAGDNFYDLDGWEVLIGVGYTF